MLKGLQKVLLIFAGSLAWSVTMVKSGLEYDYGVGFWGPNGHDGVWHISLARALANGSFEIPIFAGEAIKNYHLGFDLLLAFAHKFTTIPISVLYFQVFPPIVAVLVGLLTYKFVIAWKKSETAALWSIFFVYFGGNPGWIVTLLRNGQLGGESMFWSQQAVLTLVNPPFALSLVLITLGLLFLGKSKRIFAIICFGVLIQIKVYAGILILGGLLITGAWELIRLKQTKYLEIFFGSLILSLILFLPLNKNASDLVVWQPFWFLETMLGLSDRLGWSRFYEALMNYKLGNSIKLYPAYLVAFLIFILGNFWTRIIGILGVKKVDSTAILFGSMIFGAVVLPMLFVQEGTPWNTIQFLYYALFLSGIWAGTAMSHLSKKSIAIPIVVVLLTVPTTFATLKHYLPLRPPAKISNYELSALAFLERQPQGVVLTYPFDKFKAKEAENDPPRPLYLYESTAYVSAYSGKPVFLEDEVNLTIMSYQWAQRRDAVEEFYASLDRELVYNFLRDNDISYVYWLAGQRAALGETQLGLRQIFENEEVFIYEVN